MLPKKKKKKKKEKENQTKDQEDQLQERAGALGLIEKIRLKGDRQLAKPGSSRCRETSAPTPGGDVPLGFSLSSGFLFHQVFKSPQQPRCFTTVQVSLTEAEILLG